MVLVCLQLKDYIDLSTTSGPPVRPTAFHVVPPTHRLLRGQGAAPPRSVSTPRLDLVHLTWDTVVGGVEGGPRDRGDVGPGDGWNRCTKWWRSWATACRRSEGS